MRRSDDGWDHFRAAEGAYEKELRRETSPIWTIFDYRMRRARTLAGRDGDSHLIGACMELQANRWELAGLQGEVLAALGGALNAYGKIDDVQTCRLHCDRIKQRIDNWFEIPRVFVSYARMDKERVSGLVDFLRKPPRQAEVVWDEHFIPGEDLAHLPLWLMDAVTEPGQEDIAGLVSDAMRVAGIYMVMWSRTYAARAWTTWEMELVKEHLAARRRDGEAGPRVVLVRLDEHPVPEGQADTLWVDMSASEPTAEILGRAALKRSVTETPLLGPRRS